MSRRIILSTGNVHKINELKDILKDMPFELVSKNDLGYEGLDVVENGETLEENAFIKAKELHKLTKGIVIADDTGLYVDALNGEPGVFSSRYAGEGASYADNNKLLLSRLKDLPIEKRTAYFKTVMAVILEDGSSLTAEGICRGYIALEERGKRGFGYDPLFVPEGKDKTFSELSEEEKNKISHRANALKSLKNKLEAVIGNFGN